MAARKKTAGKKTLSTSKLSARSSASKVKKRQSGSAANKTTQSNSKVPRKSVKSKITTPPVRTPVPTILKTNAIQNKAVELAVIEQNSADKFLLLETVLQKSGFWITLQQKLYRSAKEAENFKILIKPDFNACELSGSLATDPQLVEHLIDMLHERGYRQVIVAESRNSFDIWLENRDVQILADVLGYQYVTASGNDYDVIDLSEQTVTDFFGPGSYLHNNPISGEWLGADFHILFSKNKTDDENAFYLGLNNLLSVLPLRDKDYHYKHRLDTKDVLIELLQRIEIDFCIIDAVISNHGNAGSRAARPLNTDTLIAGANLLLTDYAAINKMGADPQLSPLHSEAMKKVGLPSPYRIDGDSTPYTNWINVHPLMLDSIRSRTQWIEIDQILQPWIQTVDQESFSFQDPLNASINKLVSRYLQGMDDNPNVFWTVVSINYLLAYLHSALESVSIIYHKDRLWQKEVPLNIDINDYPLESYRAMVDYLEPLEAFTHDLTPDSNGLRWKFHTDGSVLFEYSRVIPADYDDFVNKVDISKSIQYMNDYIGGLIVPVKQDEENRASYQIERNLYLPQPNYLALYQGLDIDVSKLEYIRYSDDQQNMLWQTVKSENGSATYDDGIVRFIRTGQNETLVSIFGRQQFTLPVFWQMVDLGNYPALKERLFNQAYTTFFNNTLANFEAIYEGRNVRIGKSWNPQFGEPEQAHLKSTSEKLAAVLSQAQHFIQQNIPDKDGLLSRLFNAYNPQPEYLDEEGFAHFKHKPEKNSEETGSLSTSDDLHSMLTNSRETANSFWKGLSEAVLKDSGINNV